MKRDIVKQEIIRLLEELEDDRLTRVYDFVKNQLDEQEDDRQEGQKAAAVRKFTPAGNGTPVKNLRALRTLRGPASVKEKNGTPAAGAAGAGTGAGVGAATLPFVRWNKLMDDSAGLSDKIETLTILGSKNKRSLVHEITFVNSLKGAPAGSWDASLDKDGSVRAWIIKEGGQNHLYIGADGGITTNKCTGLFKGYINVKRINFNNCFHTDGADDMRVMFEKCENLQSLNLSGFDTKDVTSMSWMFSNCNALTSLDLSSFDTGKVCSTAYMFNHCSSLGTVNVSSFKTSQVTEMQSMFADCTSLVRLDVRNFDTGNVTNMTDMFEYCRNLTRLNVAHFNTGNVKNMFGMFSKCEKLETLNVSRWDTKNVTNMAWMFYRCTALTELDLSGFNTKNVTDMGHMFLNCSALTSLNVTGFDMSKVTKKDEIVKGCDKLPNKVRSFLEK